MDAMFINSTITLMSEHARWIICPFNETLTLLAAESASKKNLSKLIQVIIDTSKLNGGPSKQEIFVSVCRSGNIEIVNELLESDTSLQIDSECMAASTSSLYLLVSLDHKHQKKLDKTVWDNRCYLEAIKNARYERRSNEELRSDDVDILNTLMINSSLQIRTDEFHKIGIPNESGGVVKSLTRLNNIVNSINILNYLYINECGNIRSFNHSTKNKADVSFMRDMITEIIKVDNMFLFKWVLDNYWFPIPWRVHVGKLIVEHNALDCLSIALSAQGTYERKKRSEYYDIVTYSCKNIEFLTKVFESWNDNITDDRMEALLKGLPHTNFETYQYLFDHGILAGTPAKSCIKAISISQNTDDNLKKLRYTKDTGYHFRSHVLKFASVRDVNCVKWLYDTYGQKRHIWSPKFIQRAAKAGRLENIKFAHTNGCLWGPTAYYWT
jgi:hypothetical protein